MKMRIAAFAILLSALLMPAADDSAQTPPKASTFTIAGRAGEAQLLQINGKSYVDIEALARLTKGTLSFKTNETILTLPTAVAVVQAAMQRRRRHLRPMQRLGFQQPSPGRPSKRLA
jgi:hypothetical protein